MNNELVHDIAHELLEAELNKRPIERFSKDRLPFISSEDAYLIQEALIQLKRVEGQEVLAPKIGLTSKKEMMRMGVDSPIYGYLFNEMRESKVVSRSNYIQPHIQAEIGIILAKDLQGPHIRREEVMNNIAFVFSAIEIIDSRFKSSNCSLSDIIADNSSASGYILSDYLPYSQLDLAQEQVEIIINGEEKARGRGSNVLEHPAESVAALANMLGAKGITLKKDKPILTGGMAPTLAIEAGDLVQVNFTTLPQINFKVTK